MFINLSDFCLSKNAAHRWTDAEYMEPLLGTEFRVAKPYGGSCFMTLLDYLRYSRLQRDEEPLYIFDEYVSL